MLNYILFCFSSIENKDDFLSMLLAHACPVSAMFAAILSKQTLWKLVSLVLESICVLGFLDSTCTASFISCLSQAAVVHLTAATSAWPQYRFLHSFPHAQSP